MKMFAEWWDTYQFSDQHKIVAQSAWQAGYEAGKAEPCDPAYSCKKYADPRATNSALYFPPTPTGDQFVTHVDAKELEKPLKIGTVDPHWPNIKMDVSEAAPSQEPVAWMDKDGKPYSKGFTINYLDKEEMTPLYTHPSDAAAQKYMNNKLAEVMVERDALKDAVKDIIDYATGVIERTAK